MEHDPFLGHPFTLQRLNPHASLLSASAEREEPVRKPRGSHHLALLYGAERRNTAWPFPMLEQQEVAVPLVGRAHIERIPGYSHRV